MHSIVAKIFQLWSESALKSDQGGNTEEDNFNQASQREPTWASETNTEHLAVLGIFIELAFALIFVLPRFFPKEGWVVTAQIFEFKDALYGELPLIFYLMFFITVLFTTSTDFIVLLFNFVAEL